MGRPDIPAAIKREVRQRCGFGCAICGVPLYDYDHIIDYADTRRHVADEITLLCAAHHDEKTRKLLPREAVEAANRDPFNIRAGITTPFGLRFGASDEVTMLVAGNRFGWNGSLFPIVVDNIPPVGFIRTPEGIALHLHIRDSFNRPILEVASNELMVRSDAWDVEFSAPTLTLREAARRVLLKIRFEPPSHVVVERARLMLNGALVDLGADGITLNNKTIRLTRNWFTTPVGVTVGDCRSFPGAPAMLHFEVDRYKGHTPPAEEGLNADDELS